MKKTIDNTNIGEMHNPPHPGEVLMEMHLKPTGLTITKAAERLAIDRKTLSRIINGQSAITVEMAMRLAKSLGTSAKVWLGMQQSYDLWQAKQNLNLSNVEGLHTVIVKNNQGRIIADYPISVSGINYRSNKKEYFDQVKRCLIEDGIIADKKHLANLTYELH